MLKKFFWTTIISHIFIFCHSYGFFTVIPFFFLTGSTSVCYKPTSPVQVLEDTGFLYQDHQLFAGRHEVSPLTAEVISAKEKAGKFMATLLYELTAFTSRFSPKHKSSSLSHLQIIFTELKASFSFFLESKLLLTCVSYHLFSPVLVEGAASPLFLQDMVAFHCTAGPVPTALLLMEQDHGHCGKLLWSILLDFNNRQFKVHLSDIRMIT